MIGLEQASEPWPSRCEPRGDDVSPEVGDYFDLFRQIDLPLFEGNLRVAESKLRVVVSLAVQFRPRQLRHHQHLQD